MPVIMLVYLGFLVVGLPEALLGASWPAMGSALRMPVTAVVGVSVVIAACAAIASVCGEPLLRRIGTGRTVDCGVALTVVALLGFSFTPSYWPLLAFAAPYGFGSGLLVVALNAYAALRYANAHLNWMHATVAVGAMAGHTMLGWIIADGADWRWAWRAVGLVQLALAVALAAQTRRWRDRLDRADLERIGAVPFAQGDWRRDLMRPHAPRGLLALPAASAMLVMLFAYASVEQTTMLWASSYMVHAGGMSIHDAGIYANLFFIGLTAGSLVAGLLAMRLRDTTLLAGAAATLFVALAVMIAPWPGSWRALAAPVLLGAGCAPIAPSATHMTPRLFGVANTPAMIGLQTAAVSTATLVAPALFAIPASLGTVRALPAYLLAFACLLLVAAVPVMRAARLRARTA